MNLTNYDAVNYELATAMSQYQFMSCKCLFKMLQPEERKEIEDGSVSLDMCPCLPYIPSVSFPNGQ